MTVTYNVQVVDGKVVVTVPGTQHEVALLSTEELFHRVVLGNEALKSIDKVVDLGVAGGLSTVEALAVFGRRASNNPDYQLFGITPEDDPERVALFLLDLATVMFLDLVEGVVLREQAFEKIGSSATMHVSPELYEKVGDIVEDVVDWGIKDYYERRILDGSLVII